MSFKLMQTCLLISHVHHLNLTVEALSFLDLLSCLLDTVLTLKLTKSSTI